MLDDEGGRGENAPGRRYVVEFMLAGSVVGVRQASAFHPASNQDMENLGVIVGIYNVEHAEANNTYKQR